MWKDYQATLWDFDGIIVDTEWPIYESWLTIFRREGMEKKLPRETYVQCIGSDFETWSPEIYLESLTGKSYDWKEEGRVRNLEIRERLKDAVVIPGIVETWEAIRSAGVKIAVVSSSSHSWVDVWLEKIGIIGMVDEIVCRGDAPKIKPAPDLYVEAVRRFDLRADQCLVVEDSFNGLTAARAAGCDCVVIPSRLTSVLDFPGAKATLSDVREMLYQ